MRARTLIGLSALVILALCPAVMADQLLVNGGFESATSDRPDGWEYSQQAWSYPAGWWIGNPELVSPHSGNRMGVLAPGGQGTQEVLQVVDFTGYTQATLSFWWRYEARDFNETDMGRDALEVFVGSGSWWERIWEGPIDVNPQDGYVLSPWMYGSISGEVSDLGQVGFLFRIRNSGESFGKFGEMVANQLGPDTWEKGQLTVAFLDDITLDAVPEPATLALLGTGLAGLALAAWRRRK